MSAGCESPEEAFKAAEVFLPHQTTRRWRLGINVVWDGAAISARYIIKVTTA